MGKFQYAPGLPGYGNQGIDGSAGGTGLATYFTSFSGITAAGQIRTRIIANDVLFGTAEKLPGYPARVYQIGDLIIDTAGVVFKITLVAPNYFESIGSSLTSEAFFVAGAAAANSYTKYTNNYIDNRKIVDSVYSTTDAPGYGTYPTTLYIDAPLNFPVTNYSDVTNLPSASGDTYIPFMAFSTGTADANSIGLVKDNASNSWRLGNLDAAGNQRAIDLRLDFTNVYMNNLELATLSGSIDGSVSLVSDTTDADSYLVFGNTQTGVQKLKTNPDIKIDAVYRTISSKGFTIAADGSIDSVEGVLHLGASSESFIYHHDVQDALVLEETVGKIRIDATTDVDIYRAGVINATFGASSLNIVSGSSYNINGASILSATALNTSVKSSGLTTVGTIINLDIDGSITFTTPSTGISIGDSGHFRFGASATATDKWAIKQNDNSPIFDVYQDGDVAVYKDLTIAGHTVSDASIEATGFIVTGGLSTGYLKADGTIDSATLGLVSGVGAGNGMSFSEITVDGSIDLGTPSTITSSSSNATTWNSHTHQIDLFTGATTDENPDPAADKIYYETSGTSKIMSIENLPFLKTYADASIEGDLHIVGTAGPNNGDLSVAGDVSIGGDVVIHDGQIDASTVNVNGLSPVYASSHGTGAPNWFLLEKTLNIGNWDMTGVGGFTSVTHGIVDYEKIRSVDVMIRPDSDASHVFIRPINYATQAYGGSHGSYQIGASAIYLYNFTGSDFDNGNYNSAVTNRGTIKITYESQYVQ
jgi:hypothetical protein